MRLITNKPQLDEFSAGIDVGMSTTHGGADSNKVEAMINIPQAIEQPSAVNFADKQGGWIDNLPGTFTPSGEVIDRNSIGYGPFFNQFPLTTIVTSNTDIVRDNWNEAKYNGYRLGLL